MRLSWFIIIFIIIFVFFGCAPPFGNIGGSVAYESIWAVPYRSTYDINDLFVRYEDLLVFGSVRGSQMSIPTDRVSIGIIEDPYFFPDDINEIPLDEDYLFTQSGRKIVVVTDKKLTTRYSIEVFDPLNIEDPSIGGGGGGIGIIWWDERP